MPEKLIQLPEKPIVTAPDLLMNLVMQVVRRYKINDGVIDQLGKTINDTHRNQIGDQSPVIVDLNPPSFTDYASFRAHLQWALNPQAPLNDILPKKEHRLPLGNFNLEWQGISDFRDSIHHTLANPTGGKPHPDRDPQPVRQAFEKAEEVYLDLITRLKRKTNGRGGYQIKTLGKGGMGRVFVYEDEAGRRVLKLIRPGMAFPYQLWPEYSELTQQNRELMTHHGAHRAMALKQGSYEEVCLADFFELVKGQNLQDYLTELAQSNTYLNAYQLIEEIILPIVDGYAKMHEKGYVGRDLKEANLMVRKESRIQMVSHRPSWGDRWNAYRERRSARSENRDPDERIIERTQTEIRRQIERLVPTIIDPDVTYRSGQRINVAGTPAFMGPEQWDLKKAKLKQEVIEVKPGMDVYALGVLLLRLFTGDPDEFTVNRLTNYRVFVEKLNRENMPEPIKKVIIQCLNPKPDVRPSMLVVKQALSVALGTHQDAMLRFYVKPAKGNPEDQSSVSLDMDTFYTAYSQVQH